MATTTAPSTHPHHQGRRQVRPPRAATTARVLDPSTGGGVYRRAGPARPRRRVASTSSRRSTRSRSPHRRHDCHFPLRSLGVGFFIRATTATISSTTTIAARTLVALHGCPRRRRRRRWSIESPTTDGDGDWGLGGLRREGRRGERVRGRRRRCRRCRRVGLLLAAAVGVVDDTRGGLRWPSPGALTASAP